MADNIVVFNRLIVKLIIKFAELESRKVRGNGGSAKSHHQHVRMLLLNQKSKIYFELPLKKAQFQRGSNTGRVVVAENLSVYVQLAVRGCCLCNK